MGNGQSTTQISVSSNTTDNKAPSNGLKWLNCFRLKSASKADISLAPNHFPPDVLKWMKKNANPKMAFMLMRVCKYFQHKPFPYPIIEDISFDYNGWSYSTMDGERVNNLPTLDMFPECSLWITGYLSLKCKVDPFEYILSKIAACKLRHVRLQDQNITLAELKALNSCGTFNEAYFVSTNITGEDGLRAAMENILPCVSNAIFLYFERMVPSFQSSKAAATIILPKLKCIGIDQLEDNFNYKAYRIFKKTHPTVHCYFSPRTPFSNWSPYRSLSKPHCLQCGYRYAKSAYRIFGFMCPKCYPETKRSTKNWCTIFKK